LVKKQNHYQKGAKLLFVQSSLFV